jgi:glycerophosphoryl diester phosphodiesterase
LRYSAILHCTNIWTWLDDTRPLIITHNGACGLFPGCTDLAYQQAVEDGADIIDCSVQMSRDAVPFCLDSPDLTKGTTAATVFLTKAATVNEIQNGSGIFSFDLLSNEIQTLKRKYHSILFATSSCFSVQTVSMFHANASILVLSLKLILLAHTIKKD